MSAHDDQPATSGKLHPGKRRKGRDTQSVQLASSDLGVLREIMSWFPPGTLTLSRLARLAIRHGLPSLRREFAESAERYAANRDHFVGQRDGKEPR